MVIALLHDIGRFTQAKEMRTFTTEDGDVLLEKITSLNDDISLHCVENATPEQTIERTITALIELRQQEAKLSKEASTPLVDYQARIDAFASILEKMAETQIGSTSGPVRK